MRRSTRLYLRLWVRHPVRTVRARLEVWAINRLGARGWTLIPPVPQIDFSRGELYAAPPGDAAFRVLADLRVHYMSLGREEATRFTDVTGA